MKLRHSALLLLLTFCTSGTAALAQTDIRITGAQSGFPVAAPQLCDSGSAADEAKRIPEIVRRDLQISGFFKVLNPATYVETPGKCDSEGQIAYSDWSVISAEGVIRGDVQRSGSGYVVRLYLHDVQQQRAVVGKKYEVTGEDVSSVAHKFANEVVGYFTGTKGIFGTQIVYVSRMGRFKELWVMEMDGSNPRQLTWDKGLAISPAWSPGGDRIVYTSYKTRTPELYVTSPRGGSGTRITNRPGLELGAEFAPDSTKLVAAASVQGVSKIALFDLKGRLLQRLTASSSIDVSPFWSPDGRNIVFCSNRAGGPQIYVMNAGGSGIRRVSYANSNYCTSPVWSPKGDRIAYVCRVGSQNQIFVDSANGGSASQLTYAGNNEDPSFSPDGRYLAISSTAGGPRSIYILSLQTGQMSKISKPQLEHSQPAWSPLVE